MRTIRKQGERDEQRLICKYLKLRYPKVRFRTDKDGEFLVSKKALGDKALGSSIKGFPDLIIMEARKGYKGLVIELKRTGTKVYRQDGTLRQDKHLEEQQQWLDWFTELGCQATFSVGVDDTIKLIDKYLL